MDPASGPVPCSACGRPTPRAEMFGAAPDLLCPRCAEALRQRLTPRATGRMMSDVAVGTPVLTVVLLLAAGAVFLATHVLYGTKERPVPDWVWWLMPVDPVHLGSIGTGQVWRLVTSAFVHGGWLHFLFNAYWILYLGRPFELTRGPLALGLLVVASATWASGLQWLFAGAAVGLSGVLYALAGCLWAWRREDPVARVVMNPSVSRLLAVWFGICVLVPQLNVANWGHGGGAAFGLAAGYAWRSRWRWVLLPLLGLATIGLAAYVGTGHRFPR